MKGSDLSVYIYLLSYLTSAAHVCGKLWQDDLAVDLRQGVLKGLVDAAEALSPYKAQITKTNVLTPGYGQEPATNTRSPKENDHPDPPSGPAGGGSGTKSKIKTNL